MSDIAIRVDNLGKMYRIGVTERRPQNLWQAAKSLATSPFDYLRRITRPPTEEEILWALRDVSFKVQRGEVLGIIGRNGAGKTTLLKLLSRITEPTEGRAIINGRVGSLLEVGTGFHPELTGRENIYLNGAILGMKRAEIDRKFDEIVDFSGVEKFIDTPVKRYSSGMYVRLAFAVAAHLEPEILLVDEVLAVGDAAFQEKCLGKMGEVAGEGRTVLLVSHNMGSIGSLCPTALLLEEGRLAFPGDAGQVIARYLQGTNKVDKAEVVFPADETNTMCIRAIRVLDHEGNPATSLDLAHPFRIEITYQVREQMNDAYIMVGLSRIDIRTRIYNTRDVHAAPRGFVERRPGTYVSTVEFLGGILNVGTYRAGIGLTKWGMPSIDSQSISFSLVDSGYASDYRLPPDKRGLLVLTPKWTTERLE